MIRRIYILVLLSICILLAACAPPATPTTLPSAPTAPAAPTLPVSDRLFKSNGGGEPRSIGYWMIWNTCAPNNQAKAAAANGGREAGWILLDDLLTSPGILVGILDLKTCQQGIDILQMREPQGVDHKDDPAYLLAAQLMAAQLNLAVGAEACPAVDETVQAAQLLLLSLRFDGTKNYFGAPDNSQDRGTALFLIDQFVQYNQGSLCVP